MFKYKVFGGLRAVYQNGKKYLVVKDHVELPEEQKSSYLELVESPQEKSLEEMNKGELHALAKEMGCEVAGINTYTGEEGKEELRQLITEAKEIGAE